MQGECIRRKRVVCLALFGLPAHDCSFNQSFGAVYIISIDIAFTLLYTFEYFVTSIPDTGGSGICVIQ